MSQRTWRIVTPEAVALDLEAAGLGSRVLAALLDALVLNLVLGAVGFVAVAASSLFGSDSAAAIVIYLIGAFLVLVGWPAAIETLTKGRSVGKMALGLRVVTVEGAPIQFRHALVRGLVGFIEIILTSGSLALTVAMCSHRFRRLGDHLAGTVVIRETSGLGVARATRFFPQPGWEGFATALDVSRLTADHYRLIRSYLLRAPGLAVVTRAALGHQVVDLVADTVLMAPPLRASLVVQDPVAVLTAVAAAYQRRFSADPIFVPWMPFAPLYPAGLPGPVPGPYPGPHPGAYG